MQSCSDFWPSPLMRVVRQYNSRRKGLINLRIFITIIVIALLGGCASSGSRFKQTIDPLLGKGTPEHFVNMYGLPEKRETIGTKEYWVYKFSQGKYTSTTGYRFEVYDLLYLIFVEGKLYSWKSEFHSD